MSNFLYKARGKILRFFASIFRYRPSSAPFLSGDGLRLIADKIHDETNSLDPENVVAGDIIFVSSEKLNEWFKNIHGRINCLYILISHNGDSSVDEKMAEFIDEKIIHWFAQNNTYKHDKITPLPIGIENKRWFMSGWYLTKNIHRYKNTNRKNRILYGFNEKTNLKERTMARKSLEKAIAADAIEGRIRPKQYFHILNNYKLVASPEGNGSDCHRTWEAIMLGVVPITRNVSNNQVLMNNDLPIFKVEKWDDIENMTENNLETIYNQKVKNECNEIFLKYWVNSILKKKVEYLNTKK